MEDQIKKIIIAILDKTKNNILKWEQTSIINQYKLNIGSGIIYVEQIESKEIGVFLSISNEDGNTIYSISSFRCDQTDKTILINLLETIVDKTNKKSATIETIVSALKIDQDKLEDFIIDID